MRKKWFLDIYALGLYLSEPKAADVKVKATSVQDMNAEISKPSGETVSVAILLLFQRGVGTDKIVDALVTSLSGGDDEYKSALHTFSNTILNNAKDGLKAGDELVFVFTGAKGNRMDIYLGSNRIGFVENNELRNRLTEVYVGKESVAPDVPVMLKTLFF